MLITPMKNKLGYLISGSVLLGSLLFAGTAFAAGPTGPWQGGGMKAHMPGVFGTVASISGGTLTVNSKGFGPNATATTYTVDATNATVTKANAASTLSAVAVGDMVGVQGTVSGTNVTATAIHDGLMMRGGMHPGMGGKWNASSTPATPVIQGNGQPVIGGAVTAINGNSLTVTNKSNVTYTVDVTSATVSKAGVTGATISSISVGDNVVVQGTVAGTAVTASSVIDQGTAPSSTGTTPPERRGFMGAVGGFFSHLFGFF
jgi:hypothetical protein